MTVVNRSSNTKLSGPKTWAWQKTTPVPVRELIINTEQARIDRSAGFFDRVRDSIVGLPESLRLFFFPPSTLKKSTAPFSTLSGLRTINGWFKFVLISMIIIGALIVVGKFAPIRGTS